jgi:hypothetical protein
LAWADGRRDAVVGAEDDGEEGRETVRKHDELRDPTSCLNKAGMDELIFVLRTKDEDAPGTIRDWVARRIRSGKNKHGDAKIVEALGCALAMERERRTMAEVKP